MIYIDYSITLILSMIFAYFGNQNFGFSFIDLFILYIVSCMYFNILKIKERIE